MKDEERLGRDLAFAWHLVHFVIALVGLAWSLYFWRKDRRR